MAPAVAGRTKPPGKRDYSGLGSQAVPQPVRVDEVGEGLLPIHEDDGNALAIAPLEVGVVGDVDVLELERELSSDLGEHPPGALAQVAVGGVEERDPVEVPWPATSSGLWATANHRQAASSVAHALAVSTRAPCGLA